MSEGVIVALIALASATLVAIITGVLAIIRDNRNYRREHDERAAAERSERDAKAEADRDLKNMALQALLRHELKHEYQRAVKEGGATMDDRDEWSNMYEIYHSLGKNGVMDSIKEKYFDLPMKG